MSTPSTEFNPSTFVPTLPESTHFEFVHPDLKRVDPFLSTLKDLQGRNPPQGVSEWLDSQVAETQKEISQAQKVADQKNGRELAKRAVHKFRKWDPVRFGVTDECKRDFYDGSERVDSLLTPVVLEPSFETAIMEQALAAGVDGTEVLANLHVGVNSLKRFGQWVAVSQPTLSS